MTNEDGEMNWYVLRDLKRPNTLTPAYKMLEELGVEIFTPKKNVIISSQGHKKIINRPVIPDLLFAHASRNVLDPIIKKIPTLQYRFIKGAPYCTPMTVNEKEMSRFITATNSSKNIRYFTPDELIPSMLGRKITIIGGPLDNIKGNLLSIKGSRKKRLLIRLPGIIAISVEVSPEFIKFLD